MTSIPKAAEPPDSLRSALDIDKLETAKKGPVLFKIHKIQTTITRQVHCERCGHTYAYDLTRSARSFSLGGLGALLLLIALTPLLAIIAAPLVLPFLIIPLGGGYFLFIRFRRGRMGALSLRELADDSEESAAVPPIRFAGQSRFFDGKCGNGARFETKWTTT